MLRDGETTNWVGSQRNGAGDKEGTKWGPARHVWHGNMLKMRL